MISLRVLSVLLSLVLFAAPSNAWCMDILSPIIGLVTGCQTTVRPDVIPLPLDLSKYLNKESLSSPISREVLARITETPSDPANSILPSAYLIQVLQGLEAKVVEVLQAKLSTRKEDLALRELIAAANDVNHSLQTCLFNHEIPEADGDRTFAAYLDLTPNLEELIRTDKDTLRGLVGVQQRLLLRDAIGKASLAEAKDAADFKKKESSGASLLFKLTCLKAAAGAVVATGVMAYCLWSHYHPADANIDPNGPVQRTHQTHFDWKEDK